MQVGAGGGDVGGGGVSGVGRKERGSGEEGGGVTNRSVCLSVSLLHAPSGQDWSMACSHSKKGR